ncbi:MAG: DUF1344 domain-containing protein [Rhodobacteraceae bacterium]|nr:DUF1344 domain-containing protein [Paracoccaceae bacterium]
MRPIYRASLAALFLSFIGVPAMAEVTGGTITKVDAESLTITLDDGSVYKLNNEFDFSALKAGQEVQIAYDEVNGENVVTDMDIGN